MHIPTQLFLCGMVLLQMACQTPSQVATPPTDAPRSFTEAHRPQFHFSPPTQWINDPNGMVYYEGEYHLFYQHYPDSNVWGPMHWGHAVSPDLVHWEHLPIALYPDSLGYIFSGSAVIDWDNTSGLGQEGKPPMIAMFTHHDPAAASMQRIDDEYQSIAYSLDKGRSWTMYPGNPVIPNPGDEPDFRDPKVSWHEASQQWVVVFAVKDHITFYGSPDLKNWTKLSDFGQTYGDHGGVWECPDLFPLQVEGSDTEKWILFVSINPGGPNGGSATQYFVGDFDGQRFTLDPGFESQVTDEQGVWIDYGRDNYAGVTWADVPAEDGRRLFMGWMSNWEYANVVPTTTWRNGMTLARELRLGQDQGRYQLRSTPVKELEALRIDPVPLASAEQASWALLSTAPEALMAEVSLEIDLAQTDADTLHIRLSNEQNASYTLSFIPAEQRFISDRRASGPLDFSDQFAAGVHPAPRMTADNILRLHLFVDVASAELFADEGRTVMTEIFFPSQPFTSIRLEGTNGKIHLNKGLISRLSQIWN